MKLKYYLRGLGIGIVFTAVVCGIGSTNASEPISDSEVIARAKELGMVEGTVLSKQEAMQVANQNEISSDKTQDPGKEPETVAEPAVAESKEEISEASKEEATVASLEEVKETTAEGKDTKTDTKESKAENKESFKTDSTETKADSKSDVKESKADVKETKADSKSDVKESKADAKETKADSKSDVKESKANVSETKADTKESKEANKTDSKTETKVTESKEVKTETKEASTQKPTGEKVKIVIPGGSGSYTVAKVLKEAGLVADADAYDSFLCANGYDRKICSGTFEVPAGSSDEMIAKIITKQNH